MDCVFDDDVPQAVKVRDEGVAVTPEGRFGDITTGVLSLAPQPSLPVSWIQYVIVVVLPALKVFGPAPATSSWTLSASAIDVSNIAKTTASDIAIENLFFIHTPLYFKE
jgi:hypothetical protein